MIPFSLSFTHTVQKEKQYHNISISNEEKKSSTERECERRFVVDNMKIDRFLREQRTVYCFPMFISLAIRQAKTVKSIFCFVSTMSSGKA